MVLGYTVGAFFESLGLNIPTAIRSAWALFLGIALIILGNGLQSSLLTLRASLEGFSTTNVGVVVTGYYVVFLRTPSSPPGSVSMSDT